MASSKEEILRKNAIIQGLRSEVEDFLRRVEEKDAILAQISDELEKTKKSCKENARKELNYKSFQEKLEQSKASAQQFYEEKAGFLEKIKVLRTDLQRKDAFNRELKEKLDASLQKIEVLRGFQEESERLKDNLKRIRAENERKDQSIALFKAKLDEFMGENSQLKANKAQKTKEIKENDAKKLEFFKTSLKKSENSANLLTFILKRLFREISAEIAGLKHRETAEKPQNAKNGENSAEIHAFSESLSILKLNKSELSQFLNAKQKNLENGLQEDELKAQEFEEMLLELNFNEIYARLYALIAERLELERKS